MTPERKSEREREREREGEGFRFSGSRESAPAASVVLKKQISERPCRDYGPEDISAARGRPPKGQA